MNKLLLSFGLLTSSIAPAVLSANDAAEAQSIEFPFEYSWSGSEDELFFNIEVPEGFSFPETFSILTTQNGQGAEITCHADGNNPQQITELVISVVLRNTDDKKALNYEIQSKATSITEKGWFTNSTATTTTTRRGTVNNPSLNLSVQPSFTTYTNKKNAATFIFTNSFPYSQL